MRETKHLFLLQSQLADEVRGVDRRTQDGGRSSRSSIAHKWLDEGLQDRSITRDLEWGVPVNRPGFEGKVFYVWFDAPIEYIGATEEWAAGDPEQPRLESLVVRRRRRRLHAVHGQGQRALPHGVVPRDPHRLAGAVEARRLHQGFNWLTYYGGKFSTSEQRGVFMDDALDILPADYWRWYLFANAPESSDASFTWEASPSR